MCPNGVEFKTLGEVCGVQRGKRLTKSELSDTEKYPVYHGGIEPLGFYKEYNQEAETVMVINVGASAGTIGYSKEPFWSSDGCFCIGHSDTVIARFLYYYLQTREKEIKSRVRYAGIPTLDGFVVEQFPIPLPPIEIQKKIVECLDKFSALAAELQLRRKQYEYYRTQLLTPHSDCNSANNTDDRNWECQRYTKGIAKVYDWQWKTLGEIGEMIKGSGIQKSDFVEEGMPCIHYGQVHTFYGTFAYKTKSYISEELYAKCKKAHTGDLVIATTSEDVEACCKATAWLGDEDVAVSGDAHIYRHSQNSKYMAYLFQTEMFAQQKRRCATGAKVTRVHGDDMLKFRFPLPPLAEQARIVSILDKFEALTTSLSDGIPAEQAAQQKRYEYYRDLLLTFPRKAE